MADDFNTMLGALSGGTSPGPARFSVTPSDVQSRLQTLQDAMMRLRDRQQAPIAGDNIDMGKLAFGKAIAEMGTGSNPGWGMDVAKAIQGQAASQRARAIEALGTEADAAKLGQAGDMNMLAYNQKADESDMDRGLRIAEMQKSIALAQQAAEQRAEAMKSTKMGLALKMQKQGNNPQLIKDQTGIDLAASDPGDIPDMADLNPTSTKLRDAGLDDLRDASQYLKQLNDTTNTYKKIGNIDGWATKAPTTLSWLTQSNDTLAKAAGFRDKQAAHDYQMVTSQLDNLLPKLAKTFKLAPMSDSDISLIERAQRNENLTLEEKLHLFDMYKSQAKSQIQMGLAKSGPAWKIKPSYLKTLVPNLPDDMLQPFVDKFNKERSLGVDPSVAAEPDDDILTKNGFDSGLLDEVGQ